jgi:hypothetical protein
MIDDCKGISIQKLKEVLREKKKLNKNIKLTGSKAELCKQYLQHTTPKSNNSKPNTPEPGSTPKTQLYELTKKVAKTLNTIGELNELKYEITKIIETRINQVKKDNKYVTAEDIIKMMENKVSMKEIERQLRKIDDESTREDIGIEVLEDATELFFKYNRDDQQIFLDNTGVSYDHPWILDRWEEEDERLVVSMLRKKVPMGKVIQFLKKKHRDDNWYFRELLKMERDELEKLYSKKDLDKFDSLMEQIGFVH